MGRNYEPRTGANVEGEGSSNTQKSSPAQGSSPNHKTSKPAGGAKRTSGKRQADEDNQDSEGDEDPTPPPQPPEPPQIHGATKKEIVHSTDVTLSVLISEQSNEDHFLRVITMAKVCHSFVINMQRQRIRSTT